MQRSAPPQYTYRQVNRKEELKAYRRIALIITGFFVILLIIWFMGTNFINALSYLSKGNTDSTTQVSSTQDLPLVTPTIDKLPDAINQSTINVSGNTTSGVDVTILVNNKTISTVKSDDSGSFLFKNVPLTDGINLIKVVAKNSKGEKLETTTNINLDQTKPSLTISNPVDGTNYPATQKNINVTGTTEPNAIVYVNNNQAYVQDSGAFSYNLTLQPGANLIETTATDEAGNVETVKITVTVDNSTSSQ